MPSIADAFPFPWNDPAAQELHQVLSQIYPTPSAAMFVAAKAGFNTGLIDWQQPSFFVWKQLLDAGATAGLNRALLEQVRDQNPRNPRRSFLEEILAARPPTTDREPRAPDGAPRFIQATDDVTEPEALLFHDDLTLSTGRVPWLIGVLQKLLQLSPAVCRFEVRYPVGIGRGTGFRIGPDLLLTNWHVFHLQDGTRTTGVTAEFGYEEDSTGGGLATRVIPTDLASLQGDAADDWAVIRVTQALDPAWPVLALSQAATPQANQAAFIIQHPGGERKRIGFVRNQVTWFDDRVVHYLTDTQAGSSGSPVFNEQGQLIAIHHAGGRPQEVAGKPPVKKNEGIRISRIVEGLAKAGITVP
jgi:V8-like Glu-specific endopeptidase